MRKLKWLSLGVPIMGLAGFLWFRSISPSNLPTDCTPEKLCAFLSELGYETRYFANSDTVYGGWYAKRTPEPWEELTNLSQLDFVKSVGRLRIVRREIGFTKNSRVVSEGSESRMSFGYLVVYGHPEELQRIAELIRLSQSKLKSYYYAQISTRANL